MAIKRIQPNTHTAASVPYPGPTSPTSNTNLIPLIMDKCRSLIDHGSSIELITEQLEKDLFQLSVVKTTAQHQVWSKEVLVSERGRDWNAILERLLQQATIQSIYREASRDKSDYPPQSIPNASSTVDDSICEIQDDSILHDLQDSLQLYRFDDETTSEASRDYDPERSWYARSEIGDYVSSARAFARRTSLASMVSTDAQGTTTCVPSPPTRPCNPLNPPGYHAVDYSASPFHRPDDLFGYKRKNQPPENFHYPPPAHPPPPLTTTSTAPSSPFPAFQPFSKPSVGIQRDHGIYSEEETTTELQITINWVGRGTLHFLDSQPLNRTDIISRALELARSGRFQFDDRSGYRQSPNPSSLHATLRGVQMGGDYLHITSRVENFNTIYASATTGGKEILPIFEVEIRSDDE